MAKKAIQTFKDHFIGVLSGYAPTFPMHLWCQLLLQVEQQLLLLRQSRLHPNLSAYVHVYGHHDYNKHPSVPIRMEALVHNKPHKRQTYAEHCKKHLSLAHPQNTIGVKNSGQSQPELLESQALRFSSTNT
jgi:hypothetical protein